MQTLAEKNLALHLDELDNVLKRAAELATAGTNACRDFHKSSALSRVCDSIDQARDRLEEIRAAPRTCIFCEQNGEEVPAEFIAPQRDTLSGPWDFVAVCSGHASDWWDGSDYPDGEGAPAIVPIVADLESAS